MFVMKQNLGKNIEQKTGLTVLIYKVKAVKTMWFKWPAFLSTSYLLIILWKDRIILPVGFPVFSRYYINL